MPTRAFGDLRLKHADFNFHHLDPDTALERGYRQPIPRETYTGPYISAVPDIQVFDLTENDKFLVLASDGLWDELNRKESAKICSSELPADKEITSQNICSVLMNASLENAAKRKGVSRHYLGQIRPGQNKRMLVDDITIVVVDLKNQY